MNIPLLLVLLMIAATVGLGLLASGRAKSAADVFVAGRGVGVLMNASAISGEYLSAASFLGIAGLVMKNGYDALWYPVGYAAGYLFLLLFIAGPLRRFGAYTIPDFAEGRFDSPAFRKVAVVFVLFIGFFYTMPQMKGAGVTMGAILGWPYWVGIAIVGTVITFNVALGGMKGITLVQAFQYWAKLFAISLPLFVLFTLRNDGSKGAAPVRATSLDAPKPPSRTVANVVASTPGGPRTLTFSSEGTTELGFGDSAYGARIEPAREPKPGEDTLFWAGFIHHYGPESMPALRMDEDGLQILGGGSYVVTPQTVTRRGQPVVEGDQPVRTGAKITFREPVEVQILSGPAPVEIATNRIPSETTPDPRPDAPTVMKYGSPLVAIKGATAAPANTLVASASQTTVLTFPDGAREVAVSYAPKPEGWIFATPPFGAPARHVLVGLPGVRSVAGDLEATNGKITIPPGGTLALDPVKDAEQGHHAVKLVFPEPTGIRIVSGPVPNAPPDAKWLAPYGPLAGKNAHPLLWTYSLIVALVCGTAGLPHILVRFYTNPDGRAAKRTTLWVMVMLGVFYVFTPLWGTLGRAAMPILYANNTTDAVVVKLPTILGGTLGQVLSGVAAAGAFAAFMSTFSGLLVSMSGAFAHDVYGKILRPNATVPQRLRAFKLAAVAVGLVSMGLGLLVETFDIATMVGWAFAIGAASYFPLLLLGAWWRGLTAPGAAAGMLLGGLASLGAIVASMLLDKKVLTWDLPPLARALMEQPALWGVPLSLATMVLVSRATARRVPPDVDAKMLRLHAPEELGLSKNYVEG